MTRSTPARPASRLGAVLVGASLLTGLTALTACSAGQVTQTDTQVAAVPGVNVNTVDGKIAVRNAVIVYASKYPAGATMPLDLRLFNNSGTQARLTAASVSDKAGGNVVLVGGGSATPAPTSASPSPSASASPSGSKKASPSASASASASPSASPSPTSVGSSKIDIIVPPNAPQVLSPSASGGYLAIVGRSAELQAGKTTTVTLTFTYADGSQTTVTFDVPVSTPLSPPPRVSPTIHVGE